MDIWKSNSQNARKSRWNAYWNMEDLPRPLWFIPSSPGIARIAGNIATGRDPRPLYKKEKQYKAQMSLIRLLKLGNATLLRDDFVRNLQPMLGVPIFASAFGCQVDFPKSAMPVSHPLYSGDNAAEQILNIKEHPAVDKNLLGEILDMTDYFEKKSKGKIPIAATDLQSPMDSAYLVWSSCDFLCAMYTDKEAVHHLMRLSTDLFIKFVKEMRSRVTEFIPFHFPAAYLKDGQGVAVSEDVLAILSPELWEEFNLPYLNEVSEEFGGIFLHSCGNFEHQLNSIKKVKDLRGINFSVTATSFEAVQEALSDICCLMPHCSNENIIKSYNSTEAWVLDVLRAKKCNKGLALSIIPGLDYNGGFVSSPDIETDQQRNNYLKILYNINKLIKEYS